MTLKPLNGNSVKIHVKQVGAAFSSHADGGLHSLSEKEVLRSAEAGYSYADRLSQMENELLRKDIFINRQAGSAQAKHSNHRRSKPGAMEVSRKARRALESAKYLKDRFVQVSFHLPDFFSAGHLRHAN